MPDGTLLVARFRRVDIYARKGSRAANVVAAMIGLSQGRGWHVHV